MSDNHYCEECDLPLDSASIECSNTNHKAPDAIDHIIAGIVKDIKGRRGIGNELGSIDPDIREEMYEEWRKIARKELPTWVKTSDRMPPECKQVLVYRPDVLQEDPHDRPVRFSRYNPNYHREFECSRQPTEWLDNFPLPDSWNEDLEERQNRK